MNKALIYLYISELEKELLGILAYHQFAQIIVSEIVNEAIITLHELPGGLATNEKTAKDLIQRNIRSFFSPTNTVKIIDKFQNWDNRVCYGYRGKTPFNTKTLIEFKLATDSSLKQVKNLEHAMLEAVSKYSFKCKQVNKPSNNHSLSAILVGVALIALASVGIYSYSISNRYQRINAYTVFDNWTGKSIDVDKNMENNIITTY